MTTKRQLLTISLVMLITAAGTKILWPNIETKIEVQEKEVVRNDIRTVTRTVTRPDGTSESVTESTDRSVKEADKRLQITKARQPTWMLTAGVKANIKEMAPIYEVGVQKRILGNVFAGLSASSNATIGVLVSVQF